MPPWGAENGLCENWIFFSSSFHSYMGKSTIQQNSNLFSSTSFSSWPILVRASPAKRWNFAGLPAAKKTASPSLRPSCSWIAFERSGPKFLPTGPAASFSLKKM